MGDDLPDYESDEKMAGFSACPSDCALEIKEISSYISYQKGGKVAFVIYPEFSTI